MRKQPDAGGRAVGAGAGAPKAQPRAPREPPAGAAGAGGRQGRTPQDAGQQRTRTQTSRAHSTQLLALLLDRGLSGTRRTQYNLGRPDAVCQPAMHRSGGGCPLSAASYGPAAGGAHDHSRDGTRCLHSTTIGCYRLRQRTRAAGQGGQRHSSRPARNGWHLRGAEALGARASGAEPGPRFTGPRYQIRGAGNSAPTTGVCGPPKGNRPAPRPRISRFQPGAGRIGRRTPQHEQNRTAAVTAA